MSQTQREQLKVVDERAVLAGVELPGMFVDQRDYFSELRALAETAGASVVGEIRQKRQRPRARTYIGKGKVTELGELVRMTSATLVIFDNDLSPAQIRALEEELSCKIVDRSELILDIFANRATTHAAKLQVEIAQLEYTYPRLRAMWDHLGQIVGGAPVGIGTRGPGEKQLEIDRRLVQRRLSQLKREVEEIQARKAREVEQRNVDHFTVGLVGYTNAGKSTFFNRVTAGGAYANDKLFATLSTRIERWPLAGSNDVLLSDTVGFIRNLPHHLVASFRSTLEETIFSQLILILLDVSDPHAEMQLHTVRRTLNQIGAADQPRLILLNKADQLEDKNDLIVWLNRLPEAIPVSARTGEGIDEVESRVLGFLLGDVREVDITAEMADGRTIDFIERRTDVIERDYRGDQAVLRVKLGRRQVDQLLARGARFTINGMEPGEALETLWSNGSTWSIQEKRTPLHEIHAAPEADA